MFGFNSHCMFETDMCFMDPDRELNRRDFKVDSYSQEMNIHINKIERGMNVYVSQALQEPEKVLTAELIKPEPCLFLRTSRDLLYFLQCQYKSDTRWMPSLLIFPFWPLQSTLIFLPDHPYPLRSPSRKLFLKQCSSGWSCSVFACCTMNLYCSISHRNR